MLLLHGQSMPFDHAFMHGQSMPFDHAFAPMVKACLLTILWHPWSKHAFWPYCDTHGQSMPFGHALTPTVKACLLTMLSHHGQKSMLFDHNAFWQCFYIYGQSMPFDHAFTCMVKACLLTMFSHHGQESMPFDHNAFWQCFYIYGQSMPFDHAFTPMVKACLLTMLSHPWSKHAFWPCFHTQLINGHKPILTMVWPWSPNFKMRSTMDKARSQNGQSMVNLGQMTMVDHGHTMVDHGSTVVLPQGMFMEFFLTWVFNKFSSVPNPLTLSFIMHFYSICKLFFSLHTNFFSWNLMLW